ncbi:MAG: CmcJ/NvfI family oxidoreductase, partial [Gammaproteobacteria bacterium]
AAEPERERLLAGRFIEINVWRAIRGPLQSSPLAVCSAASMHARDFLACDLIYADRVGEIYEIAHSAAHEWFYFPDMQRDEALLLLGYDSDRALARVGAHSAFEHPHTPADALPRESIEARAFAFFAPRGIS